VTGLFLSLNHHLILPKDASIMPMGTYKSPLREMITGKSPIMPMGTYKSPLREEMITGKSP